MGFHFNKKFPISVIQRVLHCFLDFDNIAEGSCMSKVSKYGRVQGLSEGSRSSCIFKCQICISSLCLVPFFQKQQLTFMQIYYKTSISKQYFISANLIIRHLKYSFELVCISIAMCKLRTWSLLKAFLKAFLNLKCFLLLFCALFVNVSK